MDPNIRQKIVKLPNDNNLVPTLQAYMAQGYVIHQMTNLAPVSNNILIVYYDPAVDEVVP